MAKYTQAELTALRAAIASGETEVTYDGQTVKYRSLREMVSIEQMMTADLDDGSSGLKKTRTIRVTTSKGI